MVFIDNKKLLLDAALDDALGALVAGEKGHIHPRPPQVAVGGIQNRVELGMADIHIFCLQRRPFPLPGHLVIAAAGRHTVLPQRKNLVFRADDAGAHLAVAVLGPHGRKQGNAHEILVPADIVSTFHPFTTFPVMGCAALPVDSDFAQILPLLYCPPQPGARVIRWENAKKPGGT